MMRKALILLAMTSCAAPSDAASFTDAALHEPVTLAVKGEALRDILPLLQEQTGVQLRVANAIADQKATIFVDDKPLSTVMEGLATLFRYRWSVKTLDGKRSYRLWEDQKTRREREDAYEAALAKAWADVDADLDLKARLSAMSEAELQSLRAKLSTQLSKDMPAEAKRQWEALSDLEREPLLGPVARLYRAFPRNALDAFRAGLVVRYDSESAEEEWLLPEDIAFDAAAAFPGSARIISGNDPDGWKLDGLNVALSTDADSERAQAVARITIRYLAPPQPSKWRSDRAATSDPATPISFDQTISLAAAPLCEFTAQGNRPLPRTACEQLTAMKLTLERAELIAEAATSNRWPGKTLACMTRSDILALLHKKLGLQIISDHYSQWLIVAPLKDRPLVEFLDSFKDMHEFRSAKPCGANWGWDGEFLYARAEDVRTRNLEEVPNRLLRSWRAVLARQGALGLEEFAQISLLTDEQISALKRNCRFLGLGETIISSKGLRLYGLLSARQRKEMFGRGTSIRAFTQPQLATLAQILAVPASRPGPSAGPRVGIYKNGWRVDNRIQPPSAWVCEPVLLTMHAEVPNDRFFYDTMPTRRLIQADTFDEAWREAQAEWSDASKKNLVRARNTPYILTVTFADGNVRNVYIIIPARTRLSNSNESLEKE